MSYNIVVPVASNLGFLNSVTVTAWDISRFGSTAVPNEGTAAPSGAADATAVSGANGNPGQAVLTVANNDIYNILVTYSGVNYWTQAMPITKPASLYYGSFYDTTTQTNGGATTANLVTINTTDVASGISVVAGSKVTFANAGSYGLQFTGQFITTGGGSNYAVTVWYAVNGTPATGSAFTYTTSGVNGQILGVCQDTNIFNAGDYIQFYWWSQNTYMQLVSTAAGSNPTRPLAPSIKLNTWNVG